MKESNYTHVIHPFPALYDADSKILILGSLPSVKSREQNFFYGHPQNRFWKMLAAVLHRNHIALWDTIYSCDIIGSSDSSIKNVVPTDLNRILEESEVERIFCNGKASGNYYKKYQESRTGIEATVLPSTSPANAAFSLEKLIEIWKCIL